MGVCLVLQVLYVLYVWGEGGGFRSKQKYHSWHKQHCLCLTLTALAPAQYH